jgi:lysylphosphatidylglycerol synthetase-like protein (DUF2156 family)
MDASSLVGTLSGLLAIFTFLTGVTSVKDLRRSARLPASRSRLPGSRSRQPDDEGAQRSRSLVVLAVSAPVFVIALIITLTRGLGGSDTGGAQFLLLVAGAVLLLLYATTLQASMAWPRFFAICVVGLGVIGFLMGSVSRGEEAATALAGIFIGAVVGLFGLLVQDRARS